MEYENILGLCNLHREKQNGLDYGVCGFWNSGPHDRLGVVACNNWKEFAKTQVIAYVVSGSQRGKLHFLNWDEQDLSNKNKSGIKSCVMSVRVKGLESCLVSISAIRSLGDVSVACLGLIDKFNGIASISQTSLGQHYEAHLTHRSSRCAFWINTKPAKVLLDNQILKPSIEWNWDSNTGLLQLDMMVVPLNITTDDAFCIKIYM